ncbi:MAG: DivIVA domain-containing protein [Clostridiales Family XIII bacterium]|jgi:cell division initiation protein|nr:DivIVA domain-containing protein [Clostridiales Family XIII bacterium]
MITPADIQKTKFTKGVRGYKEDEVDSFLDLITLDIDKLINENNTLKETIRTLNGEIERYRSSEGMLFDTLESAKALMSDISSSAEKRAEIVLKNAELDADRMQREARESVERITGEAKEMARRWEQFKTRYKNLLQNELDRFTDLSSDFMSDGDAHRLRFYSDTLSGAGSISDAAQSMGDDGDSDVATSFADDFSDDSDFDAGKTIHISTRDGR